MNSRPTILITGMGGTVGQSVVKAARMSSIPCRLIGTDCAESAAGFHWVDRGVVLPHCSDPDAYFARLRRICEDETVRLILPGSEQELVLLARHAETLKRESGAIVVASPPEVLRICMDRLETCRFLEGAGLHFPRYARLDAHDEVERLIGEAGFPLIARPRRRVKGSGAARIESRSDLDFARATGGEMVLQEYLQPDSEEYAVGVYSTKNRSQAGGIAMLRLHMVGQHSYKIRVVHHGPAQAEAQAVAAAIGAVGPCKVQMIMTKRGPVTYEILPAFAPTTAMRAHFGFNEVEMALRDLVLDQPLPQPGITTGVALRFWEEVYVNERANDRAHQGAADRVAALIPGASR